MRVEGRSSHNKPDLGRDHLLEQLKFVVDVLKEKYNLSEAGIVEAIHREEENITVTIFNDKISPFESIVKFLKENKGKKLSEIAKLTGRTTGSVWQTYDHAYKKYKEKLMPATTEFIIPLNTIAEKKFSILESIVIYLKDNYNLSYRKIGKLLQRNERTVWTVYNRGMKKSK